MAFDVSDNWQWILERLERGERVTKAEVARVIRLDPSPPPRVMEWIADALEGNLEGVSGAPKKGAFDKLKDEMLNPVKQAANHVRGLRTGRKESGGRLRDTLEDDIEAAASLFDVEPDKVRKEYEG